MLPINRSLFITILFLLICISCIEPYVPVIHEKQEVMVINGMITDQPGIHQVSVSLSSPYNKPEYRPVGGCVITVQDELGNIEFYKEIQGKEGVYEVWLDESFVSVGKVYSLQVLTPSSQLYSSEYDSLLSCPPIDSLYYIMKVSESTDPKQILHGIQFYNDVRGHNGSSRNFRWKATATWEYHSPHTPSYVWNKGMTQPYLEDTVSTCYLTESIETVFAASSRLLSENSIYQNRLHYVSDQTPRLLHGYSLFLEQFSLTDQAYAHWEKMAAQSTSSSSLYETQPSSSSGNIYNVNNPAEKVLGCFYATQIQGKRIMVDKDEIDFYVKAYMCPFDTIYTTDMFTYDNYYYLISLSPFGGFPFVTAQKSCFDCTLTGGDNKTPDFW